MSPRAAWRLEALGFAEVYDYVGGETDWAAAGLPVEGQVTSVPTIGSLVDPDVPTCHLDESMAEVTGRVREAGWSTCVVVNDGRVVLGRLFRKELERGGDGSVEAVMRPGPSTYRPNVDVLEMSRHMSERKLETALVTRSDGRLMGLIRREQVNDAAATLGHHHQH
jgi:CBS domain-containing protein